MLTQKQVEDLLAEEKVITANMRWQLPGGSSRVLEVGVLAVQSNIYLRLVGRVGRRNRSFALLFQNQPIRKYTVHARHHNPDCTSIHGPHKHGWDDVHEDGIAYVPSDIPPGNINDELAAFLRECNVQRQGDYQPLML